MIDTIDFRKEIAGGAVENGATFDLAPGAAAGMTWVAGTTTYTGAVPKKARLASAGSSKVVHVTPPRRANQRVEIDFDFDSVNYKEEVLADAPLAYYRLGESSGSVLTDTSGNGRHGTYSGSGYSQGSASLLSSDSDAAVALSGSAAAALSVPYSAALNPANGFSVEAWAKVTDNSVDRTVASTLRQVGGLYYGWRLFYSASFDLFVFELGVGASSTVQMAGGVLGTTNTVRHLVFTMSPGFVCRSYENGIQADGPQTESGYLPNTTQPLRIGTRLLAGAADDPLYGSVDEVAVYGSELSPARIVAHYNAGKASGGYSLATLARTGVVGRYVDANNYVLLYNDHATPARALTLVERKAGVDAVKKVFTPPASAFRGGKGAVRLELVGRRARLWYETARPSVRDRPPDDAATLSSPGSDATPGGWGFYMEANAAGTGMRVRRFAARDMADAVLPPPYVKVESQSGLLNLTPITLTASGVDGSADKLEWEVAPVDAEDFPEKWEAEVASAGSGDGGSPGVVAFVRPGYEYEARWRTQNTDGTYGAWSAWLRFTAPGSRVAPSAATMPAEEFPLGPALTITATYPLPRGYQASVSAALAENGRATVVAPWPRPRAGGVKVTYEYRNKADTTILVDFFNEMRGRNAPFKWTHPRTGQVYAMRFVNDEIQWNYPGHAKGVNDADPGSQAAALSFEMEEVIMGGAGAASMAPELDPVLY